MKTRTFALAAALMFAAACMDAAPILEPGAAPPPGPLAAYGDSETPCTGSVADRPRGESGDTPPSLDTDCGGTVGPSVPPVPRWLENGYNLEDCRNTDIGGGDSDGDGLNDTCEYDVAEAFAPIMMVDSDDDISRDEYWVVMPGQEDRIMVFYAFGYHDDTGYNGHTGDSEFVVMDVIPATERDQPWGVLEAFLSAHYGEDLPTVDDSDWIYGSDMEVDPDVVFGGRPVVWVAKGKHANYSTRAKCNNGGASIPSIGGVDTCEHNNTATLFGVYQDGNLGQVDNRAYPTCKVPSRHSRLTGRYECFWAHGRFYGWQGGGEGSTGYRYHLAAFGFDTDRASM